MKADSTTNMRRAVRTLTAVGLATLLRAQDAAPSFLVVIHRVTAGTVKSERAYRLYETRKKAGATDTVLLVIHDVGHGVFMQHRHVTHPPVEAFLPAP